MRKHKLLYVILLSVFLFSGCPFVFSVLDYVDENNKSYITIFKDSDCIVEMKYLGSYYSFPDTHAHSLTKEMILNDQTFIRILGPSGKENEILGRIIDCHVELKDNDLIVPYRSIEVRPTENLGVGKYSIIYKSEKDLIDSKPKIGTDRGIFDIFYLYDDINYLQTANFNIKLTLLIKGKIHIIEKSAFLKRKEGKVLFTPFCKIHL